MRGGAIAHGDNGVRLIDINGLCGSEARERARKSGIGITSSSRLRPLSWSVAASSRPITRIGNWAMLEQIIGRGSPARMVSIMVSATASMTANRRASRDLGTRHSVPLASPLAHGNEPRSRGRARQRRSKPGHSAHGRHCSRTVDHLPIRSFRQHTRVLIFTKQSILPSPRAQVRRFSGWRRDCGPNLHGGGEMPLTSPTRPSTARVPDHVIDDAAKGARTSRSLREGIVTLAEQAAFCIAIAIRGRSRGTRGDRDGNQLVVFATPRRGSPPVHRASQVKIRLRNAVRRQRDRALVV